MSRLAPVNEPVAVMGDQVATDLMEATDDLARLSQGGRWAVAIPYAGPPVLARFSSWAPAGDVGLAGAWSGVSAWESSMNKVQYCAAIEAVRGHIERGTVYQTNICRILTASINDPGRSDIAGLFALLQFAHSAPYAGMLRLPQESIHIACASPELFLSRDGNQLDSGPIKGTAATSAALLDKDYAENVMIVDLVRNDFAHVCLPGSVSVPELTAVRSHPGLVHLESRVRGVLHPDHDWAEVFAATFPPGSITGAPRFTAEQIIDRYETVPRQFYCGAFGWIDADTQQARLAVSIRTFWRQGERLCFGTGAGITWSSDAATEWDETVLKASRLTAVAQMHWPDPQQSRSPVIATQGATP